MSSLFDDEPTPSPSEIDEGAPLAYRMRPRSFDECIGQAHLVSPSAGFRRAVESGRFGSIILWGPPGVGKTTLAEVVAVTVKGTFERVSAVSAGVAELRKVVEAAKDRRRAGMGRTILFVDEIHRFNKAQQDSILPVVESGLVSLIGATTENPSFEVNSALLSRCRVFVLNPLTDDEITEVIRRGATDADRGLGLPREALPDEVERALVNLANGDARSALNMLELTVNVWRASGEPGLTLAVVESAVQKRAQQYDKGGEEHYNLISALHKSVRGSDPDAAVYWLARMLDGGEDPLYLARRIVRMSTEDIGLADPQALPLCLAAQQAVHFLGMPEGALALAEAVVYLSLAPKSNAIYRAYGNALKDIAEVRNDPVPLHLRNSPTGLMKELDYGKGYRYAHDFQEGAVYQQNLPDRLANRAYYVPTGRGFEGELKQRLEHLREIWRSTGELTSSTLGPADGHE
jgi:putative ATPase